MFQQLKMNVSNECDLFPVNRKSETNDIEQPDENNNLPTLTTLTTLPACNEPNSSLLEQVRMRALAEKHQKLKLIHKLIKCVESNNFDHFRMLLTQKPDLNLMVDGQCLIHFCIMMRMLSFFSLLLSFFTKNC